jgi:type I restriction enzyme S subunit
MANWQRVRISDLGPVVTGKTPPSSKEGAFGGAIPFVTPSDMNGERYITKTGRHLTEAGLRSVSKRLLPSGAILVSCIGSDMGKTHLALEPCFTNQQINSIQVTNKEVHPLFVYYNLFARKDELQRLASGSSAQPILNKSNFSQIELLLPPYAIQCDIVEVPGSLDDKIELNRRMNETLEAMAQAIFRDWFVDFGPTRRKLEGATDPVTIMGGLVSDPTRAQELADLFPATLGDDGLPEGWEQERIEDLLTLSYGKALPKGERREGPYPVYGSGGIGGWHNSALVRGPSIVVGRKGTVGSLFWEERDFFPIDTVFYVTSREPLTYCYYLLQTLGLTGMNTDAAVPGLNRNNVYRLIAPRPPKPVVEKFGSIADTLRAKIAANDKELSTLAATRDLLLPKLMSGEIRLGDAEEIVEAAQ